MSIKKSENYMNNLVIFPIIFLFLNFSPKLQVVDSNAVQSDSLHSIYLIKQRWHTAVVFHKEEIDSNLFPVIKYLSNANLIDIGWGDAEFYQYPGFDSGLAWKALFYSTPSTLRVEGIYITKKQYFDVSEIVVELEINDEQLISLLNYINETIWRNSEGVYQILSTQHLNQVYFFKAYGNYHLFNTCNTWLAVGLKQIGFEIEDNIILTEQLFQEAAKVGKVLKVK